MVRLPSAVSSVWKLSYVKLAADIADRRKTDAANVILFDPNAFQDWVSQ